MVAVLVIMIDEFVDLVFETAGEIIVPQQIPVPQRLMRAFGLALGLRMIRRAVNWPLRMCSQSPLLRDRL